MLLVLRRGRPPGSQGFYFLPARQPLHDTKNQFIHSPVTVEERHPRGTEWCAYYQNVRKGRLYYPLRRPGQACLDWANPVRKERGELEASEPLSATRTGCSRNGARVRRRSASAEDI